MRRYLTPRCLALHATILVLLPAFAWLTWWQYSRATSGNGLSWAYVFLWPAFGIYAVYTWWNLVHDQLARQEGAGRSSGTGPGPVGSDLPVGSRPPGWALTGGRQRNVAIAAGAPIDVERGGKGERYRAQTADEAARLAEYNRYLAALGADDAGVDSGANDRR